MLTCRAISVSLVFVFFMSVLLTSGVRADEWALPKKQKYYSPNKKYYLQVTPKKLEGQLKYFEDKVDNRENAGALQGVKDNQAKAAFYGRRSDGT